MRLLSSLSEIDWGYSLAEAVSRLSVDVDKACRTFPIRRDRIAMKVVIQRVCEASLCIAAKQHAAIGPGLVLLVGIAPSDNEAVAKRMAERILGYRVFEDDAGKMNRSVSDIAGQIMVVPNFTLYADTRSGRRPSFSKAAPPAVAAPLFDRFVAFMVASGLTIRSGVFGADMQVSLCNDGPVTLILEEPPAPQQ